MGAVRKLYYKFEYFKCLVKCVANTYISVLIPLKLEKNLIIIVESINVGRLYASVHLFLINFPHVVECKYLKVPHRVHNQP